MQVSVRSYLVAGTVAVVGAGAVALTPVVPARPMALPAPAVIDVALSGVTSPLAQIIDVVQSLLPGGSLSQVLNLLPTNIIPAVIGVVLVKTGRLAMTALTDVFGEINTTLVSLVVGPHSVLQAFGSALANIPNVLTAAVQALATGNVLGALSTVTNGLSAPLTGPINAVVAAGNGLGQWVLQKIANVALALPNILLSAVQSVVGGGVQAAIKTIAGMFGITLPAASVAAPTAAVSALPAADPAVIVCNMPAVRNADALAQPVAEVPAAAPASASRAAAPRANRVARAAASVAPAASAVAVGGSDIDESSAPVNAVVRQDQAEPGAPAATAGATRAKAAHSRGETGKRAG